MQKTITKYVTRILLVLLMITFLLSTFTGCGKALPKSETLSQKLENDGYEVVFEDNFNGDKLDESIWINGYPSQKRAAAYYTEDAVFVKDGNLIIRTNYRENGALGTGWYTGWIETADSTSRIMEIENPHVKETHKGFKAKYGYFEARLKVPKFKGMWSAFWLMPVDCDGMTWHNDTIGTATDGVEIDIIESFNYAQVFNKNQNTNVVHMDGYGQNLQSFKSDTYNIGSNIYDEYHTYGVLWDETGYIFYVDGKESWRFDGAGYGVSQVEECILLTCEVPGMDIEHPGQTKGENGKLVDHWSGKAYKNNKNKNYDFIVDYVKVYQVR